MHFPIVQDSALFFVNSRFEKSLSEAAFVAIGKASWLWQEKIYFLCGITFLWKLVITLRVVLWKRGEMTGDFVLCSCGWIPRRRVNALAFFNPHSLKLYLPYYVRTFTIKVHLRTTSSRHTWNFQWDVNPLFFITWDWSFARNNTIPRSHKNLFCFWLWQRLHVRPSVNFDQISKPLSRFPFRTSSQFK